MDFFNNLNTIIGVIVGLITIGGFVLGIAKYFQKKATSAQAKQTMQLSPDRQTSYQNASKSLSKWDWLEVLWCGLEDSAKAKDGNGIIISVSIGLFGLLGMGLSSAPAIAFIIFLTPFISINLLFYSYFVGRRIEKKIEEINNSLVQKVRSRRNP